MDSFLLSWGGMNKVYLSIAGKRILEAMYISDI